LSYTPFYFDWLSFFKGATLVKNSIPCELDFCKFNKDLTCALSSPPTLSSSDRSECILIWLTTMFSDQGSRFIKCEANYCIHNRNESCSLSETPTINEQGLCDECEFVALKDEFLKTKKEELLRKREVQLNPSKERIN
jgi:hypothetical protein